MKLTVIHYALSIFCTICFIACSEQNSSPKQEPIEQSNSSLIEAKEGILENSFEIKIQWEKNYENSLLEIDSLEVLGFQGPDFLPLVAGNTDLQNQTISSAQNTGEALLFIQLTPEDRSRIFSTSDLKPQEHQLPGVFSNWTYQSDDYIFEEGQPLFAFTKSELESISSFEPQLLRVGGSFFEAKEGLPQVYCIRSPQDELPFGPHSFDMLNEEQMILADPLKNRVVVINSKGDIGMVNKLDFSPSGIRVKRKLKKVEFYDEQGDAYFQADISNFLGPAQEISREEHDQWQAVFKGRETLDLNERLSGELSFQAGNGLPADKLSFQLSPSDGEILSVHSLGREANNQKYVLLQMEKDDLLYELILKFDASNQHIATMKFPYSSQVIYLENEFSIFDSKVYRLESKDQVYKLSTYRFDS